MNSRRATVYLVTATLLLGGCVVGERYSTTIERRWPAQSIRNIAVDEIEGNVTVSAGSPNEVSMVARVNAQGIQPAPNKENQGFFETELSGDTLRIGQHERRIEVHFPFVSHPRVRVDYTLVVPPAVALELKTVNGKIAARGIEGETQVTTVNGEINVDTPGANELSAKTVNGPVTARFLRDFRGANLKTVNGSVEALLPQSASFTCDLTQVNGDFEASFPLSIHSHPGSRRVSGEVNGGQYELRITTVNGDVEVQHLPHEENAMPAPQGVPPAPPQPPQPVS